MQPHYNIKFNDFKQYLNTLSCLWKVWTTTCYLFLQMPKNLAIMFRVTFKWYWLSSKAITSCATYKYWYCHFSHPCIPTKPIHYHALCSKWHFCVNTMCTVRMSKVGIMLSTEQTKWHPILALLGDLWCVCRECLVTNGHGMSTAYHTVCQSLIKISDTALNRYTSGLLKNR